MSENEIGNAQNLFPLDVFHPQQNLGTHFGKVKGRERGNSFGSSHFLPDLLEREYLYSVRSKRFGIALKKLNSIYTETLQVFGRKLA